MSAFWSWRLQSNRVGQKIGLKPKMILNKVSFRELDKQRRTLESLALDIEEHKKKTDKKEKKERRENFLQTKDKYVINVNFLPE